MKDMILITEKQAELLKDLGYKPIVTHAIPRRLADVVLAIAGKPKRKKGRGLTRASKAQLLKVSPSAELILNEHFQPQSISRAVAVELAKELTHDKLYSREDVLKVIAGVNKSQGKPWVISDLVRKGFLQREDNLPEQQSARS